MFELNELQKKLARLAQRYPEDELVKEVNVLAQHYHLPPVGEDPVPLFGARPSYVMRMSKDKTTGAPGEGVTGSVGIAFWENEKGKMLIVVNDDPIVGRYKRRLRDEKLCEHLKKLLDAYRVKKVA